MPAAGGGQSVSDGDRVQGDLGPGSGCGGGSTAVCVHRATGCTLGKTVRSAYHMRALHPKHRGRVRERRWWVRPSLGSRALALHAAPGPLTRCPAAPVPSAAARWTCSARLTPAPLGGVLASQACWVRVQCAECLADTSGKDGRVSTLQVPA